MTDKKILSIDSESTCLKENAFTIDFMNEGYLLTLYVPAITEFLSKNSSLEKTAYNRGISVVKSDLFPRKFLYSKCSFEANKDRLALAYKFYLNKDLNLDKVEASKVVINVDKNLSKKDTARLLQASADDWVAEQVQYLNALSHALSDATSRNYFVAKSLKNDLNFRLQSEAFKNGRNIVDNLTIYSNAQMANYFLDRGLPFIYRNNEFNNDNILFDQVKKENTNTELLTLLEKLKVDSYFSAKNKGHNGLRKQAYGQISIPCRSYAAYVCQKLIIKFLIEKEELTEEDKRCLNSELEKIAGHLNNRSKINAEYLHERAKVYQYRRGI